MVGVVVVAHSAQLAEAVVQLSQLMLQKSVPIVAAGGTGEPQHPFGTNATQIQKAIESVYTEDGVVVLMDTGSAILSAETALEFLTEEQRSKVRLCEAPIVEGAIAAAVRAECGGSLNEVIDEAVGALTPKAAQLNLEIPQNPDTPLQDQSYSLKEARVKIQNRLGIHARPAAKFVSLAGSFRSDIAVRNVTKNTAAVNAKSINLVATLGASQGHEILISASGPDADQALSSLKNLVERGFDEDTNGAVYSELGESPGRPKERDQYNGIAIAPGIAIGPAVHFRPTLPEISEGRSSDPETEWKRLLEAIRKTQDELRLVRERARIQSGDYQAAIFDAHLLYLHDPALLQSARQEIFERQRNAELAWQLVMERAIHSYQLLVDPYLRGRDADLIDLKVQVLQKLTGQAPAPLELKGPAVLVAPELKLTDIVRLDPDNVLGICTAMGDANSHCAILARSLGIPVVFGAGQEVVDIAEGTTVVVDGDKGSALANPADIAPYQKQLDSWVGFQKAEQEESQKPALTVDGKHIRVMANIGSLAEARKAIAYGAEGIGLVRSEFFFGDKLDVPSEDEQTAVYGSLAQLIGSLPVTFRTFDVGGDKTLPIASPQIENNPFMGERGIRLSLSRPDLFKVQLRSVLRASLGHRFRVMFPMVSSFDEVRRARQLLAEVKDELRSLKVPFEESVEVGIMIETPSAAIIADHLAKEVDFFSIGSNDLSQYVTAADRTNARVAGINDIFHPAVLRLIRGIIKAARETGIDVGLCGEMVAQPLAIPLLIGLGMEDLSVNVYAIPVVKRRIRQLNRAEAVRTAGEALEARSAIEVRKLLEKQFGRKQDETKE